MKTKAGVEKRTRAVYETRAEAVAASKAVRGRMASPDAWKLDVRRGAGLQDSWLWYLLCGELRVKAVGNGLCCSGRGYYAEGARTADPNRPVLGVVLGFGRDVAAGIREFHRLAERLGYRGPDMDPMEMEPPLGVGTRA